ncbi:MAG TPA: hypothetical protein VF623_02885 [Segetibacter sp.]
MKINLKAFHCYAIIFIAFILYPIIKGVHILPAGDTGSYQEASNIILNGYRQITFRVPFYPLLLILTGSTKALTPSLFVLQYLVYFLSILFLVKAMLRSEVKVLHVFIVTLLLVSPPFVQINYYAMTEAISFAFVNILFSIFILVKRSYKFLLMGILASVLTLTRPSFQLTGLLLTGLFLLTEKSKWKAGIFIVSFALPLFIFSMFNKSRFNFTGLTPATGWHVTTKTALFIDDWPDAKTRPLMVRQRNDNLVNKSSHTGTLFVWSLPELLQDSLHMNYIDASKYMMRNNTALIKSHPLEYLTAVGRSLVDYTFPNLISSNFPGWMRGLYTLLQFAYMYLALILTAAVWVCLWLFRRRVETKWLHPFLFAAIVIYSNYFVSIAAEVGSSRHRVPTEALILISIVFALPIIRACRATIISAYSASGSKIILETKEVLPVA